MEPKAAASVDTTNLSADALALVFDIGSGFLKAGYAGEDAPRIVIPTLACNKDAASRTNQPAGDAPGTTAKYILGHRVIEKVPTQPEQLEALQPVQRGEVIDYQAFVRLLEHVYSKELRVESDKFPILVTESPTATPEARDKIADVLFRHFRVPAVCMHNQAVLSLYSTGNTRGIVLESGEATTHVVPVFEGYPLTHAIQRLNLAGGEMTAHLHKLLGKRKLFRLDTARDMKEKVCKISTVEWVPPSQEDQEKASSRIPYELPDGQVIEVGQRPQYEVGELLFRPELSTTRVVGTSAIHPDKGIVGIHQMIHDAIELCDSALRPDLYKNIVLAGGSSTMTGLGDRLYNELDSLGTTGHDVHITMDSQRKYASWIGGSMFASMSTFKEVSVSRQDFEQSDDLIHRKQF